MEGYGNENPGAFQSTRPLRGATSQPITKVELLGEFQPTRPLRGATCSSAQESLRQVFQPTRPLRGATRGRATAAPDLCYFNPRAPCGARRMGTFCELDAEIFQPTRPLRGATLNLIRDFRVLLFQPTRPLRGATANAAANDAEVKSISTHAPLAGRDFKQTTKMAWDKKFQPTRPLRGATSDKRQFVIDRPFQPTRPLRGATAAEIVMRVPVLFQPTRPLRGATLKAFGTASSLLLFQPTRPLRGATCGHRISAGACRISTHAPLAGRDYSVNLIDRFPVISTHAPLAGRDGLGQTAFAPCRIFQPTRPLRGATTIGDRTDIPIFISTHAPLAGRDSKSVQITMHIFAITDKFQMLLHRMPPVRAFCSFLMQENHADFGCEPPK